MNHTYQWDLLLSQCSGMGIYLDEKQLDQFQTYYEYLVEQNQVMNLTAITDFEEVLLKHFLDSLTLVRVLSPASVCSLIDVGTGAGFPGLPLKIAFPHLQVVLADSLNKRVIFLNNLIKKLDLQGITAVHGRAEELGKRKEYRESFDLAVSRAVSRLSVLSEYCIPFVKTGGYFIPYKSMNIDLEYKEAEKAIRILGGQIIQKKDFLLPLSNTSDDQAGRSLIVIKKIKNTPAFYPRKAGTPSREPL